MNKTTEEIRNGKLIRITEKAWEILKAEKKKQEKSMARIITNLIEEKYDKNNKYKESETFKENTLSI